MHEVIDFNDLIGQSDFTGEEAGYPDYEAIGFYQWKDTDILFIIDCSTGMAIDIYVPEKE